MAKSASAGGPSKPQLNSREDRISAIRASPFSQRFLKNPPTMRCIGSSAQPKAF
jgi:hypothetical protein